jgi:hypothetical protein
MADTLLEPEIPPRESLLEDIRPICYSIAGETDGSAETRGIRHVQGCCSARVRLAKETGFMDTETWVLE